MMPNVIAAIANSVGISQKIRLSANRNMRGLPLTVASHLRIPGATRIGAHVVSSLCNLNRVFLSAGYDVDSQRRFFRISGPLDPGKNLVKKSRGDKSHKSRPNLWPALN